MLKAYPSRVGALLVSGFVVAVLTVAGLVQAAELPSEELLPPMALAMPLLAPMAPEGPATTTEPATPTTTPVSVVITNPAEDGEVLLGEHTFTATFTDNDDVTNEISWYISYGDCETVEGDYMAGSELSSSTFDGESFSATVDMTSWYGGAYCFVVDPYDASEETDGDVIAKRNFYVEELYLVGGYKYEDVNNNNTIDEDDAVVSGFTIVATSEDGDIELTDVTDEDGWYGFLLPEGEWTISEASMTGWEQVRAVSWFDRWSLETIESSSTEEMIPMTCVLYVGGKMIGRLSREGSGDSVCDFLNRRLPEQERNSSTGTKVGVRKSGGAPKVLGASTSTVGTTTSMTCEGMYLKDYLRMGQTNNPAEVMKLQIFLNAVGITVPVTSVFDEATDRAVRAFQLKYLTDVLSPWGIADATGYVYKTTRAKINNMVCPNSEPIPTI